jgi:hypothetical protein
MFAVRCFAVAALFLMTFLGRDARALAADETAAVEGTITLDGKPLAGARVFFHVGGGQFVGAKTDKDGKYKAKVVPTGQHKVTVELWKEMPGAGVTQLLPAKYSAEDKTALMVEVKQGANTIDLNLTSK